MNFKQYLLEKVNDKLFVVGKTRTRTVTLKDGSEAVLTQRAGFAGYGGGAKRAETFIVSATVDGKEAAHAEFKIEKAGSVSCHEIYVRRAYQRKGLATAIYDYVAALGNAITPSSLQSDEGKAFWKGRK